MFAQNLAYLMRKKCYSKYRLAKELRCHQTTVANWLSGDSMPQGRMLFTIAEHFEVDIDDLVNVDLAQKEKPSTVSSGELDNEILRLFMKLSPEDQERELAYLREKTGG